MWEQVLGIWLLRVVQIPQKNHCKLHLYSISLFLLTYILYLEHWHLPKDFLNLRALIEYIIMHMSFSILKSLQH